MSTTYVRPTVVHHLHCFKELIGGKWRYQAVIRVTDGSARNFKSSYRTLESMLADLAARLKKTLASDHPVNLHCNIDLPNPSPGSERIGVAEFDELLLALKNLVSTS